MPQLVEIAAGVWVRPERVSLICARTSLGKPTVSLQIDGADPGWGWTFETSDEASNLATKLAAIVNAALAG